MTTRSRRAALVAVAAALLPVLVAAPAAADTLSITTGTAEVSRADPRFTTVSGSLVCPPGDQERIVLAVLVQGRSTGSDTTRERIPCTGTPQSWQVEVQTEGSASWRPGNASVVAQVLSPPIATSPQLIRLRWAR